MTAAPATIETTEEFVNRHLRAVERHRQEIMARTDLNDRQKWAAYCALIQDDCEQAREEIGDPQAQASFAHDPSDEVLKHD